METLPVPNRKRKIYERCIRFVDMFVYLVVLAGGFYAVFATPESVIDELDTHPWLIALWASFLVGGGLVGFVARLSRRWILETPATVAAFGGVTIYLAVLGKFAFDNVGSAVAAALIIVAGAFMLRRWLELQMYGAEPNLDLKARIAAAIRRRTENAVHRDS